MKVINYRKKFIIEYLKGKKAIFKKAFIKVPHNLYIILRDKVINTVTLSLFAYITTNFTYIMRLNI